MFTVREFVDTLNNFELWMNYVCIENGCDVYIINVYEQDNKCIRSSCYLR